MSKKEKESPSPVHGLFDQANHLLGPPPLGSGLSPTGLPFPALAHLPAFSFLGPHPGFNLFGGLPSPLFGHGPSPVTGSLLSGMKHLADASLGSPTSSKQSSSSSRSKPSKSESRHSSSPSSTSSSSATRSLLNGSGLNIPNTESRKRKQKSSSSHASRRSSPTVLPTTSSTATTSSSTPTSSVSSDAPLALISKPQSANQKTSPTHKKRTNKLLSENGKEKSDDSSSGSSLSDDSSGDNLSSDEYEKKAGALAHQIDGLKKKLLADQIRQRVQNKPETVPTSPPKPRGRPPKSQSVSSLLSQNAKKRQETEAKRRQEDGEMDKQSSVSHLKRQLLEAELRQQQEDLKHQIRLLQKKEEKAAERAARKEAASSSGQSSPEKAISRIVSPSHTSEGLKLHISKAAIAKHLNHMNDSTAGMSKSNQNTSASDSGGENSETQTESDSGNSDDESGSGDSESEMDASRNDDSSQSGKHDGADDGEDASPAKRRRIVTNENDLRIPLEHGWQRQTTIHAMGRRGIVGEVLYFAPCGKKMKTIPDVMRYLDRNGITDLSRDNFTFNTKVNVGEFSEMKPGTSVAVPMSEVEVLERIAMSKGKRARMKELAQKRKEKAMKQQELAKHFMEVKLKRKLEQQELARKAAEIKFQKRLEIQRQKDFSRKAKQVKAIERRKQKEQMRLLRHQEKLRKQDQLRQEREMRAQQVLEEREMKRQQAMLMREQERERRRQHLLLVKALEARKKQEEKERVKVERLQEKKMFKERKLEQRRLEYEMARELKRPCEDMELRDTKELPEFPRIPGVKVAGSAFADCLMAIEFMHNFGDALGLDKDSIPTMKVLQNAILNENDEDVEEFMSLMSHLLRFALNDPGVPNPKESTTKLNQKIADIELTDSTLSEILRIFIMARNGKANEMSAWLEFLPLEALNPTKKAAILAFMCNELLGSRVISAEVDKNIETINTLRRDKWLVEGKLRQLRTLQAKKFRKADKSLDVSSTQPNGDEDSTNMSMSKQGSDDEDEKDEDEDKDDDESGNDSDATNATNATGTVSDEEDDGITKEECEKKLEKLTKQHGLYRNKVFDASHKLRGLTLGQDRYKRRFWILPHAGGVFVEGLESSKEVYDHNPELVGPNKKVEVAEGEKDADDGEKSNVAEIKEHKMEVEGVKEEVPEEVKEEVKEEKEVVEKINEDSVKEEKEEMTEKPAGDNVGEIISSVVKSEDKILNGDCEQLKMNDVLEETVKSEPKEKSEEMVVTENVDKKEKTNCKIDTDLFLKKADITKLSDILKIPRRDSMKDSPKEVVNNMHTTLNVPSPILSHSTSLVSSTPVTSPCPSSPSTKTETKHNFTSIDSLLKKETSDGNTNSQNNNHFLPPNLFPPSPLIKDHHLNSYTDILDQKPWFSILPRMPCDEQSLTRTPHTNNSPSVVSNTSLSYFPFLPFSPTSPSFGSFQLGRLQNSTLDSSILTNSDTSLTDLSATLSSFKVPPPPCDIATSSCVGSVAMEMLKPVKVEPQPIPDEMQLNWWRIREEELVKEILKCLHSRGTRERNLMKNLQKYLDYACACCSKANDKVLKLDVKKECNSPGKGKANKEASAAAASKKIVAPRPDHPDTWHADANLEVEMGTLEEVEALEERIYQASLQVKGWKLPPKATENTDIELVSRSVKSLKDNQHYPLDVARSRLILLESNVERRYLKPPLIKRNVSLPVNLGTPPAASGEGHEGEGEDGEAPAVEENIPPGLQVWRKALAATNSCSQLMLCLLQLNNAISWEKSIMKVICQICRKDDNEAELLLCDGCDKGYHTYCFKPKMVNIPDGDWYCYECVSKASGAPHCIVCGKRLGKIVECDHCPRAIHIDCLDPPLPRIPKKWACPACMVGKKPKRVRKKRPSESRERKDSEGTKPEPPGSAEKKKRETSTAASKDKDLVVCGKLLTEMEKHDHGWPFLQPVNTKKFPSYKKFIKQPMDFTTMRNKLRDNLYKSRQEFANDARTVFNNCEIFNEDESEVGQAGHIMRKFLEKRYKELFGEDS